MLLSSEYDYHKHAAIYLSVLVFGAIKKIYLLKKTPFFVGHRNTEITVDVWASPVRASLYIITLFGGKKRKV